MRGGSTEAHEINSFHLAISPSLGPRKTLPGESSVVCVGEGRMVSSHMKKQAGFVKDRRFQKPEMPPTTNPVRLGLLPHPPTSQHSQMNPGKLNWISGTQFSLFFL